MSKQNEPDFSEYVRLVKVMTEAAKKCLRLNPSWDELGDLREAINRVEGWPLNSVRQVNVCSGMGGPI